MTVNQPIFTITRTIARILIKIINFNGCLPSLTDCPVLYLALRLSLLDLVVLRLEVFFTYPRTTLLTLHKIASIKF